MILDENSWKSRFHSRTVNGQSIVLGEGTAAVAPHSRPFQDYYNHDVLTHLYTLLQVRARSQGLSAGELCAADLHLHGCRQLHEISNHLGHGGDHMLRSIADGIGSISRTTAHTVSAVMSLSCCVGASAGAYESLAAFRHAIREMGYEVSVGVSESTDRQTLNETVNQAETAHAA